MEVPVLSANLIELLDKTYPLRNPSLSMTERDIWYRAGQRSVIEALLAAHEDVVAERLKGRTPTK